MDLTQWAMPWVVLLFLLGFIVLFGGGHYLVYGSARLAKLMGIHPIIIGLTVVAMGTSMPEFLVSLVAAIKDKADVALGNIVGSNISNIGLILGTSGLLRSLKVNAQILKFDLPIVLGLSAIFWFMSMNGVIGRVDGLLLTGGFAFYMWTLTRRAKYQARLERGKTERPAVQPRQILVNTILIVLGIAGLTFGANWTISAASEISRRLGVPELVLGLTVIALGTSLPELATCLVAALKNQGDIGIGNIIGSNLFNMMFIVGPVAAIHPLSVAKELIYYNIPIMLALTALMYPMLKSRKTLSRLEGGILLACYVAIMLWWILSS